MSKNIKNQGDLFALGWFVNTLCKLDLADSKDIPPQMLTKIRIHQIEDQIEEQLVKANAKVMRNVEKDIYWGEEVELEAAKKK